MVDLISELTHRRKGHTLEAPFYTDPSIFDADMDVIFGRHWLFVGVEPDVPEPGDVMVVDIGKNSVMILRDDDGEVRAFHNVCRHRGARLIHDEKTMVGNIMCRYHSWIYNTAGELIHTEHMGEAFDRSCHGLKPVHVRSLEGLLFICLADEPPADFDDMAAQMAPYIAPHNIRNTKVAYQHDLIEPGNWKLTMENNRECYHCGANHPELTVPLFAYGFGFAPEELSEDERAHADNYTCMLKDNHRDWESIGLPSREIDRLDDMITGFRTERLPLAGDGESHTIDTKRACRKLLGNLTNARAGGLHFWTQPNSWHHFLGDHAVVFSVLPLDAEPLAPADQMAGPQGRCRGCRLRSAEPDRSLDGHQSAGFRSCRLLPAGRLQRRLRARTLFAAHRDARGEILQLVCRPDACASVRDPRRRIGERAE